MSERHSEPSSVGQLSRNSRTEECCLELAASFNSSELEWTARRVGRGGRLGADDTMKGFANAWMRKQLDKLGMRDAIVLIHLTTLELYLKLICGRVMPYAFYMTGIDWCSIHSFLQMPSMVYSPLLWVIGSFSNSNPSSNTRSE